ncbi:MAG TPA: hypothetical protein DEF34_05585 [Desulfotomaculum sp.]|nr:MAG: hypothetical protein VR67_07150 [Peptococcaceae bacterium BRH_c8a]KJS73603.1 MAG: hypothetical protein JL56_10985 [Desulfotomaculum sp. BICA1-6]HBX23087.1 hypothetical protein [Desulfotomaculum sp.]
MHTDTAVLGQTCRQVPVAESVEHESVFVEQVQSWLEEEDSIAALLVGYGLCGLTAFYLLGCVVRGLLG